MHTIGADPEFEFWAGGDIFPAHRMGFRRLREYEDGVIGVDATGLQVELRPKPVAVNGEDYESAAQALYWRVRKLAKLALVRRPGAALALTGHRYPLGCHLHFGVESPEPSALARKIDQVVGDVVEYSGKARGGYGRRAAWRDQPWGLEYRTPPSLILMSDQVAIPVIALATAAATGQSLTQPLADAIGEQEIGRLKAALASGETYTFDYQRLVTSALWWNDHDVFAPRLRAELYLHLPIYLHRHVSVFGYRVERGDVTNIPQIAALFGWQVVPHPDGCPKDSMGRWRIGLPYEYRRQPKKVKALAGAIEEYVTKQGAR